MEIFIDVDEANEHLKDYIPDFDLVEFYEKLEDSKGYVLIRANEKIDHVIGELYNVDERIKRPYYKLKCIELLLFFSIVKFTDGENIQLSKRQTEIVENVKNDLIGDLESKITIDQLADRVKPALQMEGFNLNGKASEMKNQFRGRLATATSTSGTANAPIMNTDHTPWLNIS